DGRCVQVKPATIPVGDARLKHGLTQRRHTSPILFACTLACPLHLPEPVQHESKLARQEALRVFDEPLEALVHIAADRRLKPVFGCAGLPATDRPADLAAYRIVRKALQDGAKAVPAENTDDRVSMAALGVVEPLLLEPEVLPQQPEDHAVAGACSTWRDGCGIPDLPLSLIERPQHGAREPVGAPIERVGLHEI